MGPEHSSCRPERYLQLCADDPEYFPPESEDFAVRQLHDCNWIVACCSTPANVFHILRRQITLPFRKPLVMLYPKSLLRLPTARSSFDEMTEKTEFRRVIPDPDKPSNPKKLVFCSGKIYYEFKRERDAKNMQNDIALIRIEQVC